MIRALIGDIIYVDETKNYCLYEIETKGGVCYEVKTAKSENIMENLPLEESKFFIYHRQGQNGEDLFAFSNKVRRDIFEIMLKQKGMGGVKALGVFTNYWHEIVEREKPPMITDKIWEKIVKILEDDKV